MKWDNARPGMQLLLELLRGGQQRRWSESDFSLLLEVATEENVVSWMVKCLQDLDADFTPQQMRQLDELHRAAQVSSFVWSETLKSTLDAFHHSDIPVISLKGPFLAERIYGDASLRTCHDLDLLVRERDVSRAKNLLGNIGFSPNGRADDYHRAFRRKSINLELHHNVENPLAFDFDMEGTWSRAISSNFHGAPTFQMAPFDELLYLCLHAVRHRFDRVCLVLDLRLAFRKLLPHIASIPQRAEPVFDSILVLGWMLATHLDSGTPTVEISPHGGLDWGRLQKISISIWDQLMCAPKSTLDWAAQHAFYCEIESPGWSRLRRRVRHQRILATRLIDDDFVFASRFHLHRGWQVRLLRPIRLLSKNCVYEGRRPRQNGL